MNSPVRLGVSPTAASTPTGVFTQRFEALFPRAGALGCVVCFAPPPSSPFIYTRMWGCRVCQPPPCGVCQLQPGLPRSTICHLAVAASRHLATSPLRPAARLCPSYQSGWMFLLYLLGCWTSILFNFLSVLGFFAFKFVVVLFLVV